MKLDPNADLPMVRHEGADESELPAAREEGRTPGWHIVVWSLVACALVGVWIMAFTGAPQ